MNNDSFEDESGAFLPRVLHERVGAQRGPSSWRFDNIAVVSIQVPDGTMAGKHYWNVLAEGIRDNYDAYDGFCHTR